MAIKRFPGARFILPAAPAHTYSAFSSRREFAAASAAVQAFQRQSLPVASVRSASAQVSFCALWPLRHHFAFCVVFIPLTPRCSRRPAARREYFPCFNTTPRTTTGFSQYRDDIFQTI